MFLEIFRHFQELKEGLREGQKQEQFAGRKRASFPKGLLFLAVFVLGFPAPLLASSGSPQAADQGASEFEELCRWKADIAAFAALEQTGRLEFPKTQEECVKDLEKRKEAVAKAASTDEVLAAEIREMVSGYPMEVMAPVIAQFDRDVAALIVGIAKKESNWGKRVPLDSQGADCFNYWGFKAPGTRGTAMGHGCFGSPEEAVTKIGNRLTELVALRKSSEPSRMIVWKCGSSCATHTPESVQSWIGAVNLYYRQLAQK